MTENVKETVGVVLAALRVERMLLGWAAKLTPEERHSVTRELTGRKDQQALLDIWDNAKEINHGNRNDREEDAGT